MEIRPPSDIGGSPPIANALSSTAPCKAVLAADACEVSVKRDAKEVPPASEVRGTLSVFNTQSTKAAIPALSRGDIILKRLDKLMDERHISPIIFKAAARRDYETYSRLLEEGVDCDIPGPSGRRLAHVAAINGDMRLLSALIKASRKIWSTCSQGKRPLDYAVLKNHLDVVRLLVEKKGLPHLAGDQNLVILERSTELAQGRGHSGVANYLLETSQNIRRTENERLFKDAVAKNDTERVKQFLKEGISEPSALWDACEIGSVPLVSILLSSTLDGFSYDTTIAINFVSTKGQKDLLLLLLRAIDDVSKRKSSAARAYRLSLGAGQVEICESLVLCGEVDVQYAFEVAGDYGNLHLLRWIIGREGKGKFHGDPMNRAFHATVSTCFSLPLVQFLVENGADVNSKHETWGTVLQCAAANNSVDIVHYLILKGGADITAPGRFGGSSPMMAAISAGNLSMFNYFLGLQTSLKDQHGKFGNILQTASYLGRREVVEKILSCGFDVNARLEPYGSALIMAIQGGHLDIVQLLISRGADVNLIIPTHGSALHVAAAGGAEGIVRSLIRAGANVNSEGGDFGTPLQAAAANGRQLIVLFLLDCGAEVNTQGGRYGNALQAAWAGGYKLLSKLLLFSGARVTCKLK